LAPPMRSRTFILIDTWLLKGSCLATIFLGCPSVYSFHVRRANSLREPAFWLSRNLVRKILFITREQSTRSTASSLLQAAWQLVARELSSAMYVAILTRRATIAAMAAKLP